MPEGKFVCCTCHGRYKWFVSDGHVKTYIPKKNRPYAEKLAYKKYLELLLEELMVEYKACITQEFHIVCWFPIAKKALLRNRLRCLRLLKFSKNTFCHFMSIKNHYVIYPSTYFSLAIRYNVQVPRQEVLIALCNLY